MNTAPPRVLFTDVDDTLTTEGRLLPETYSALWQLSRIGVDVIPITGGCAGWCDQIARTWPVAGVVGEGGAFYVRNSATGLEWVFWDSFEKHKQDQKAIIAAVRNLSLGVELTFAKDQAFRHVDVAVDYNQDCRLDRATVSAIKAGLEAKGYTVKISSIHLNIALGEFNKARMASRMLSDLYGINTAIEAQNRQVFFIGDAPNDESMFSLFHQTAGVGNIRKHLEVMQSHPQMIATQPSGMGFVEIVSQWINSADSGAVESKK